LIFFGTHTTTKTPSSYDDILLVNEGTCVDSNYVRPFSFLDSNGDCLYSAELKTEFGEVVFRDFNVYDNKIYVLGNVLGTAEIRLPNNQIVRLGKGVYDEGEDIEYTFSTFIAVFNEDGSFDSVKILNEGAVYNSLDPGKGIFIQHFDMDSNGNIVLLCSTFGQVTFGAENNIIEVDDSIYSIKHFIVKYNNNGDMLWLENWESFASESDMIIDKDDNLLFTFGHYYNFDVDPKSGEKFEIHHEDGDRNLLLVKLDEDANYLWSSSYEFATSSIEIANDNNILITGFNYRSFVVDVANNSVSVQNKGRSDGFIMKVLNGVTSNTSEIGSEKLLVFPNPSGGIFNIINRSFETLKIYNQIGQLINDSNLELADEIISVNLDGLPKGNYQIVASNKDQSFVSTILLQ